MSSNRSNLQFSSHRSCSVPQCTNRSVRGKISLHRFPTDARLREAWRAKLRINKLITTHMQVCSIHFLRHDFFWSAADGRNCPIPKKQRLKRGAIPSQFLPVENHGRRPANLKSQCRARKKTSQKPCQKPRESKPTDGEDQQEAVPQGESFGLQSCSPLRHEEARSGDLVQAEQLAHTERSDTGCGNSWLPPDTTEASVLDKVGELVNAIPGLRPGMLLAFRIPQGRGNPTEKHQRAPGLEPCWPVALYRHGDSPDCWPAPQHGASPESENDAVQAAPRCEQLITGDTTGTRVLDADFTSQEQAVGNSVCRGLFAGNGRCTGIPDMKLSQWYIEENQLNFTNRGIFLTNTTYMLELRDREKMWLTGRSWKHCVAMALQGFWRRLLAFPQCHGCHKQRRNLCYGINATVDTGTSASKSPSEREKEKSGLFTQKGLDELSFAPGCRMGRQLFFVQAWPQLGDLGTAETLAVLAIEYCKL